MWPILERNIIIEWVSEEVNEHKWGSEATNLNNEAKLEAKILKLHWPLGSCSRPGRLLRRTLNIHMQSSERNLSIPEPKHSISHQRHILLHIAVPGSNPQNFHYIYKSHTTNEQSNLIYPPILSCCMLVPSEKSDWLQNSRIFCLLLSYS